MKRLMLILLMSVCIWGSAFPQNLSMDDDDNFRQQANSIVPKAIVTMTEVIDAALP